MKTVNFIFGIHNHQPVGNFDYIIEDAYQRCYLPFIEVVEEFPEIPISFHISGCLSEWMDAHHPDYLDRVAELVKRRNVEIISGGFFEPILVMIPDIDKVEQIKLMSDYIKKRFDYEPKGLWLAERVWEPHLAKFIAEAGISYIPVDDYHFLSAGLQEEDLIGYFTTEEQGKTLSIFPMSQKLRYSIPFKDPQETIDYLSKFASEDGKNLIVFADDGEKFGVWPGTYKTVFEEGWLRKFFNKLLENSDWVKLKTFSEYFSEYPPAGRIYLPSASYFEMSEWSLPWRSGEDFGDLVREFEENGRIEQIRPFLKGGVWRNFLFKYDESNWMQKRMVSLSDRLHRMEKTDLTTSQREKIERAKKYLWRGMCNCAYWHGIFGGLYLPHLRHAIYQQILKCEKILNEIDKATEPFIEVIDFDADGRDEIIFRNRRFSIAFAPHSGAILQELSLLGKSYNLLNTLKRRKESYHRKVLLAEREEKPKKSGSIHELLMVKEKGLHNYLKIDKYPRKMLVDHIISRNVTLDQFRSGDYYEDSDFINGDYKYQIYKKSNKITFLKDGWVNWKRFCIKKEVVTTNNSIIAKYHLKNMSNSPNQFRFGPEFNFAMLTPNSPDRYYFSEERELNNNSLRYAGEELQLKSLSIIDRVEGFKVTVRTEAPADFWIFPIETVSLSESGFEKTYQSSAIIPWFDINIMPDETISIPFYIIISDL